MGGCTGNQHRRCGRLTASAYGPDRASLTGNLRHAASSAQMPALVCGRNIHSHLAPKLPGVRQNPVQMYALDARKFKTMQV